MVKSVLYNKQPVQVNNITHAYNLLNFHIVPLYDVVGDGAIKPLRIESISYDDFKNLVGWPVLQFGNSDVEVVVNPLLVEHVRGNRITFRNQTQITFSGDNDEALTAITEFEYLGVVGDSAYQVWLNEGNEGTVDDYLLSLKGEKGSNGASSYMVWLSKGNEGTVDDYLLSLKGEKGSNGASSYEVWLGQDNEGTIADYLLSLKGDKGSNGASSYEVWLSQGNEGTIADYLLSLKGEQGEAPDGVVTGPNSSNDHAIARFHGETGKVLQDYTGNAPTISDEGEVAIKNTLDITKNVGARFSVNGNTSSTMDADIPTFEIKNSNTLGYAIGKVKIANGYLSGNPEIWLQCSSSETGQRTVSNHPYHIWTNNVRRVTVSANGNVGIGTTSPSEKLHIIGKVKANEVHADNGYTGEIEIDGKTLNIVDGIIIGITDA